ncbi:hypothetical protein L1887_55229 [Cichorium endivia]|nr:hypothetical protein L1887_55229 [Cichorium endivia]
MPILSCDPAQTASLRSVLLSASHPRTTSITSEVHLRLSRRIARCCAERLGGSCGARCGGGYHLSRLDGWNPPRAPLSLRTNPAELECAALSGSPPCLAARRTSDKNQRPDRRSPFPCLPPRRHRSLFDLQPCPLLLLVRKRNPKKMAHKSRSQKPRRDSSIGGGILSAPSGTSLTDSFDPHPCPGEGYAPRREETALQYGVPTTRTKTRKLNEGRRDQKSEPRCRLRCRKALATRALLHRTRPRTRGRLLASWRATSASSKAKGESAMLRAYCCAFRPAPVERLPGATARYQDANDSGKASSTFDTTMEESTSECECSRACHRLALLYMAAELSNVSDERP